MEPSNDRQQTDDLVFHLRNQVITLHSTDHIFKSSVSICIILTHFNAVLFWTCLLISLSSTA